MIEVLSFKLIKSVKNEAEFTSRFGGEIKKRAWFFHKISDIDRRLKPFDAMFALGGLVWAIEFKCIAGKSCYPYRLLRWSSVKNTGGQVKGLVEFQNNGGTSLVIVYSKKVREYKVLQFIDIDFNTHVTF